MNGEAATKTDVLIAGMGPVGAMLSLLLARSGLSVTIVERDGTVYPLPRAAHLDHEILRLLNLVEAASPVLKASQPLSAYEFRNGEGVLLMGFTPGQGNASTGYPPSSMFHQPTMEQGLRDVIARTPAISVHLETSLIGFVASDDGVVATVKDATGERQIAAKFLVGCDGGASIVRKLSGIALDDLGFDEPWLVIDTKLKNGVERLTTIGLQHCNPERPVTSMPMGPSRHRWEFMMLPGETAEDVSSDEAINRMVAPYADPAGLELERRAVYRFHAVNAQVWRKGPVLLCGDAAHQMPPFMGQGLCSGIRDASNLAWKLVAVIKGEASAALLDTYQPEREPHVRAITEIAVFMGRLVCTQDKDEAAKRDHDMTSRAEGDRAGGPMPPLPGITTGIFGAHASVGQIAPAPLLTSGKKLDDDIGYVPFLVTRDKIPLKSFAGGGRVFALADLAEEGGALAHLMGDAAACLVRPDRLVFGAGEPAELIASWHAYVKA